MRRSLMRRQALMQQQKVRRFRSREQSERPSRHLAGARSKEWQPNSDWPHRKLNELKKPLNLSRRTTHWFSRRNQYQPGIYIIRHRLQRKYTKIYRPRRLNHCQLVRALVATKLGVFITPPPVGGRGIVFGRFVYFFVSLFLSLFLVSNITRKRLDRFA